MAHLTIAVSAIGNAQATAPRVRYSTAWTGA